MRPGTWPWPIRSRAPWPTLPLDERRAIELAYFDGRTYVEVAELLDTARRDHKEPHPQRHAPHAGRPGRGRDPRGRRMMSHRRSQPSSWPCSPSMPWTRDEHELIEAHLAECPRCRAELDAHREVAAALGNSVEPLPEGLWSSIASALPPRPRRRAAAHADARARRARPPTTCSGRPSRARAATFATPRAPQRSRRRASPWSPDLGGVPRGRRRRGRRRPGHEPGPRQQPDLEPPTCDAPPPRRPP